MKRITSLVFAVAAAYGYFEFGSALFSNQITIREVILLFLAIAQTILLILNNKEKNKHLTTEKIIRSDGSQIPEGQWEKSGVSWNLVQTSHPFLHQLVNKTCLVCQYSSELHMYFPHTYLWVKLYDEYVSIEYISVIWGARQQGKGTHAMKALIAAADATNTELRLNTEPVMAPGEKHFAVVLGKDGDNRIPVNEIPAWFEKFGFVKDPENPTLMKRLPNQ